MEWVTPFFADKFVGSKLENLYSGDGKDGMADMGEMGMKTPRNSVPMVGAPGPRLHHNGRPLYQSKGARGLGDLKPEEGTDFLYGGWYENPPGTQAMLASVEDLERDLGSIPDAV